MKKMIALCLVILTLTGLYSCKPTPDNPVVVGKGDGNLEKIIAGKAAPEGKYEAPSTWKESIETFTDGSIVTIDAKITVPDATKFPVYRVSAPQAIDQEYADKIMNYFIGDDELYSTEKLPETKNEILQQILKLEDEINNPNSEFNTTTKKEVTDREFQIMLEARQESLKALNAAYGDAPASVEKEKVPRELTARYQEKTLLGYFIDGATEDGTEVNMRSNMKKKDKTRNLAIAIGKNGGVAHPEVVLNDISEMNGIKKSLEEAQAEAKKLLKDLGKEDYEIQFTYAESAYENKIKLEPGQNIYDFPRKYKFLFSRVIDGIPVLVEKTSRKIPSYTQPWFQEQIGIGVSDDGVCYFSETAPFEMEEKLNTNVPLMSFDKIQEKFRKHIAMSVSYFHDTSDEKYSHEVVIDDIRLGFYRILQCNRSDSGLLVPVWMFYGTEVIRNSDFSEGDIPDGFIPRGGNTGHSYLCINAVDGSIIDLTQGY